jgi:hypothetical protein
MEPESLQRFSYHLPIPMVSRILAIPAPAGKSARLTVFRVLW